MGNTAVAVLHYDHMGEINWGCPPIYEAMRDFPGGSGRELRGYFGFGNVISWDGSGGYQVTVVHGNTGWRLGLLSKAEPVPPDDVLEACAEALRRHGWKVERPEPKIRRRALPVERGEV